MPRYRRRFAPGQTVFLTLCCHRRTPWLANKGVRPAVLESLRNLRARRPFRHHGYVLLDDHVHLLLSPAAGVAVPALVGDFKRTVQMRVNVPGVPRLWQPRYYDHVIRDAEDFARHLDYMHFNPVKHGLVGCAAEWRWSSLAAWTERGAYPVDRGSIEPLRTKNVMAAEPQPWCPQRPLRQDPPRG